MGSLILSDVVSVLYVGSKTQKVSGPERGKRLRSVFRPDLSSQLTDSSCCTSHLDLTQAHIERGGAPLRAAHSVFFKMINYDRPGRFPERRASVPSEPQFKACKSEPVSRLRPHRARLLQMNIVFFSLTSLLESHRPCYPGKF